MRYGEDGQPNDSVSGLVHNGTTSTFPTEKPMGTNTRIRSMALAALLAAACGGGDGTECGPGTIEVEDQCRPVTGGGEAEAEAESEAESDMSCGDEWTVCAVGEQCWSLSDVREPTGTREVCGPPNPLIGILPGRWLLVERVDEDERGKRPQPTNDLVIDVTVDPRDPDCHCSKQDPGDACVRFGQLMILSGDNLYSVGFNGQPVGLPTDSCYAAKFPAEIEGQVLQDGQRVEYTARYATGGVQRLTWEKQ